MVTFLDQHRDTYGVEPICALLPIAPSTYFRWKAQQQDPTTRSARAQRDDERRAVPRCSPHSPNAARTRGSWTRC
jgi:hypothetical protein